VQWLVITLLIIGPFIGMSNLWLMVEGLQLFVLYPLMQIDASANLGIMQKALRPIATLDFLDPRKIKRNLWYFLEDEKLDYYLEEAGYKSNMF